MSQGSRRTANNGSTLAAFTAGAMTLPGLAGNAAADAPIDLFSIDYAFSYYLEDDIPGHSTNSGKKSKRMEVQSHQIHFDKPWSDTIDLDINIMHEVMSGASPILVEPGPRGEPVQVMSGATIEDSRTDFLPKVNCFFKRGRTSLSGGVSSENDYLAGNIGLDGELNFNEKNTTLLAGLGASFDTLTPTDTDDYPLRVKKAKKESYALFAGLSQVISKNIAVQSTINYAYTTGFLSDPYKEAFVNGRRVADSRPSRRQQVSWLTRYRQHFGELAGFKINGSLHLDYRLYLDDWDMMSHTVELAWHQSLWDKLQLVPMGRYYTQSQTDFYAPYYDTARSDGYASSDYRLSPFGAASYGIKAETRFVFKDVHLAALLSWERYVSDADLALGSVSVENPGLASWNLIAFGISARY